MNAPLLSAKFPENLDRRVAPAVDVFAGDRRKMENTLILQAFKASEKRFSGESITAFGMFV